MAISNRERVGRGLTAMREGLAPYVMRQLKAHYQSDWWQRGVENTIHGSIGADAINARDAAPEDRMCMMDVQALLVIMWKSWNEAFMDELGHTGRSYVSELREVRNQWAHQHAFSAEDASRALDTMTRLLQMVGAPQYEQTEKMGNELLRARFEADMKKETRKQLALTEIDTAAGLKPWREIATPHPDVSSGQYQQAVFAADLFQVLTGKASPEYQDPKEFFRRTYLTDGLIELLANAWKRLTVNGGDPVVQLQTSFGGGKTHSMLALYHMFSGGLRKEDVPGLEQVEALVGGNAGDLPEANRAVLSGTSLDVDIPWQKPDGTVIHTLWGELAYQLGGPEAYAVVEKADKKGVSPGSETLVNLFDRFGPSLILIDEWVAYARQLYGKDDLAGGSFDSAMTFVQALTEAAKAASDTLVVASIPESDIEVGGQAGQNALERIKHVFGRVETVWKPATADESFEIVRRRLFEPITDFAARDAVVRAFADEYKSHVGEYPADTKELDYENRMKSSYPIHPELFDRLYHDWSTLERFQRTRGLLRMLAAVIYALWERDDKSLMIMPGTIPMDSSGVRTEITRYLPQQDAWPAVIDGDVDGPNSAPLRMDRDNPNLGRYSAARRVSRTVFLASAPAVSQQRLRGCEEVRVKLGCVQPGEHVATYGDALRRLSETLNYLYSDGNRYWYDTKPTVTRTARDRATQYTPEQVEDEIIDRLRKISERGHFCSVHMVPMVSSDVPDEQRCRLVVLGPQNSYVKGDTQSRAFLAAEEILGQRGSSPRMYKNMLLFLAADDKNLEDLKQAVREWMAWTSIGQDEASLNLDHAQKMQVETNQRRSEDSIEARIKETYCRMLVPAQEGTGPLEWQEVRLSGSDSIIERASRKAVSEEHMILQWSPILLKRALDTYLWKDSDHVGVRQLWDYYATYLYLARLKDSSVLQQAIADGVGQLSWKDFFGYAAAYDEGAGRYQGLVAGQLVTVTLDPESVLVKPEAADTQLRKDAEAERIRNGEGTYDAGSDEHGGDAAVEDAHPTAEEGKKAVRFYGSVELDPLRLTSQVGTITNEVLVHLTSILGAEASLNLEIRVDVPGGIPENVIRIVTENCNTLKFGLSEFEEE